MISQDQVFAPFRQQHDPHTQGSKAPSFISTPAWNIETAVGAATWPSGVQLWKGKIPPSTAKPKNTGRNQMCWKRG